MSEASDKSQPPFPAIRRIITGHTSDGKSVFLEDKQLPSVVFDPKAAKGSRKTDLYRTDEFPNSNDIDFVESKSDELMSEGGNTFRTIDIPPHQRSPFHRTVSLDYAIMIKGSIVCRLDNDKRTTLKEGDVLIQRGTIHEWINETDEWTRICFVMLASKPLEVNGKLLGTEFH